MFDALLFNPLYNALIFFIDVLPYADVGFAVILLTLLVKLVLFPLSLKAVKTNLLMRQIEPEVKKVREKYKDKQEQALKMMALYKEQGVNPFSSILLLLIQLPIVIALYFVFLKGGLPDIQVERLYSFIPVPETVHIEFLGLVDLASRSIVLAILAGATQYFQIKLSLPPQGPRSENATMQEDFARSLQTNMRYMLPVIVVFVAAIMPAAVPLYWLTSNVFAIGQELYVRRHIKPTLAQPESVEEEESTSVAQPQKKKKKKK